MANTKLLLVEDDENLAYMEKSCFEDIIGGYEVKTAVNGKEGLKVWQDFQPDVIVSDIDMPIMDGIEMVKKIREVDGKTIILFTTGLTSPQYRVTLGNLKQFLEQSYGFVHDRLKILGTMTYLHQTETRTFEIQTCRGCSLNHFARQDTWSRIEIVLFHVILFVVYLISIS